MNDDANILPQPPLNSPQFPGWTDLLAFLGIFLLGTLTSSLIVIPLVRLLSSVSEQAVTFTAYAVQFAITIGLTLLYRHRRGGKGPLFRFSLKWFNAPLILWGVVLVFMIGVVIEPLLALFPDSYLELLNNSIGQGGWAVAMTVVLAPVMEETLFRGIVLESIRSRFGAFKAIMISAAVFGIIHVIPQQVINAFFVGIVLGFIYVKTESLASVIILHAINNALAYLQTVIFDDRELSIAELTGGSTLYYIVYGISAAVCILALIQIIRYAKKGDSRLPAENNNTSGDNVDNR